VRFLENQKLRTQYKTEMDELDKKRTRLISDSHRSLTAITTAYHDLVQACSQLVPFLVTFHTLRLSLESVGHQVVTASDNIQFEFARIYRESSQELGRTSHKRSLAFRLFDDAGYDISEIHEIIQAAEENYKNGEIKIISGSQIREYEEKTSSSLRDFLPDRVIQFIPWDVTEAFIKPSELKKSKTKPTFLKELLTELFETANHSEGCPTVFISAQSGKKYFIQAVRI